MICFFLLENTIKIKKIRKRLNMNNSTIFRLMLVLFVALLGTTTSQAQQENQYTQFMYNKLYLNPAVAGVRGIPSITALYRNQWIGFEGSPKSMLASFDAPLFGDRVGIGINLSNHTIGIMENWYGSMSYSYKIQLSDEAALRFGLQGSVRYLNMDFSNPDFNARQSGDNSIITNAVDDQFKGNFGLGMYFTYADTYLGISAPRFFPNEIGLNNFEAIVATEVPHFYVMAGTLLPLNKKITLSPSVLAKYVLNAPFDLDINLCLVYDERVTAGISYRIGGTGTGDSVDFMLLYRMNSITIGLAYDLSISEIRTYNSGSFEGLVRYDFLKEREDMANPRFFD